MQSKDEKIANINIKIKNFFYRYVEFTQPFHKLRKQLQQVLALLLFHHYKLKQEITNNKILWKAVFDYDTKLAIAEELGITQKNLENQLSALRKLNVINDNQIALVYIPTISNKSKKFTITFNFNILHDE